MFSIGWLHLDTEKHVSFHVVLKTAVQRSARSATQPNHTYVPPTLMHSSLCRAFQPLSLHTLLQ